MSIMWMDDPQFYNTSELSTRYAVTSVSAAWSVTTASGRFGGPSFHCVGNNSSNGRCVAAVPATQTGTIAASFSIAAFGSSTFSLLSLYDTGTLQCDVRVNSSGFLICTRNGTQIGPTSTNSLSLNTWYRIELQCKIDPSTGTVEVRVNGTSTNWIPQTTGLNTRNTANSSFNQAAMLGAITNAATADINDFVVTDNNSPNAGFLGDKRCYLLLPSADSSVTWTPTFAAFAGTTAMVVGQQLKDSNGNVQQVITAGTTASSAPTWATTGGANTVSGTVHFVVVGSGANPGAHNWMAVSEPIADGDSSYNASSTPTQVDLFGAPSMPSTAQNVAAVNNVLYARKDDAGTRTIAGQIKSGSTTATGSNQALSTSYQFLNQIQETDPNTSAAWTVAAVNAMKVGYDEVA